jgi:hypothetical protein
MIRDEVEGSKRPTGTEEEDVNKHLREPTTTTATTKLPTHHLPSLTNPLHTTFPLRLLEQNSLGHPSDPTTHPPLSSSSVSPYTSPTSSCAPSSKTSERPSIARRSSWTARLENRKATDSPSSGRSSMHERS